MGSLLLLIVVLFLGMALKGNASLTRTYGVQADQLTIPTDSASIARREHWVKTICIGCHQEDLSGGPFFDAPFATIDAKNLTSGEGGAGREFKDADWIRALRQGVNPENGSLMIMPAIDFTYFSDTDLTDIIAYVISVPPVDKVTREPHFNLLGKAMVGAGMFGKGVMVAQEINHTSRPSYPPVGVTAEYGSYMVNVSGCHTCHGPNMAGGKSPDPSAKAAPNLTPGGELVAWQVADFIKAIRTGVTLSGKTIGPKANALGTLQELLG